MEQQLPSEHFYSRPYTRGDLHVVRLRQAAAISTRAPTRGATPDRRPGRVRGDHFYSRPYARGDAADQRAMLMVTLFLLAPLREGRQQFFTKPQVDLYDKLLKIHIFQINTFCIL